jgi:hypothetical protein
MIFRNVSNHLQDCNPEGNKTLAALPFNEYHPTWLYSGLHKFGYLQTDNPSGAQEFALALCSCY